MALKFALPLATVGVLVFCGQAQAANPDHVRQLLQTNSCPDCNLSGISLKNLDLSESDLSGADLSGAKLDQSNFSRAQLRKTNFQGASIVGTKFNGANLAQADFSNAKNVDICQLSNVGFGDSFGCLGINLFRTIGTELCEPEYELKDLKDFKPFCSESQAFNSGFSFFTVFKGSSFFPPFSARGANLEQSNFHGVNLTGADFRYATLSQTNFEGAMLRHALFLNTETSQALNAKLEDAFVTTTDIRDTVKAEEKQKQQRSGYAGVGTYLRSQQAYFLENNRFANQISDLDARVNTEHFVFTLVPQADPTNYTVIQAKSKIEGLRSLAGLAYQNGNNFLLVLCETESLSQVPPMFTTLPKGPEKELTCPVGSRIVL